MRVVLVTGGSSGIGLAAVRRLAAAGDRVFAASRNPTRVDLPDEVTPIVLDVGDPDAAAGAIAAVIEAAGRIDVVVNNAGVISLGPMEEAADDAIQHILEVNVLGPMRLARAAIPAMRAQGGGRIVNVTSMNDVQPAPFAGWYSPSKAALSSASAVLDAEVHEFGIFVTVIAPGLFATDIAANLNVFTLDQDSPYRAKLETLLAQNAARMATAADPDLVATAIETCIASDDPPVRVVVGADAEMIAKLMHDTPPDDFARMMRTVVAALGQ